MPQKIIDCKLTVFERANSLHVKYEDNDYNQQAEGRVRADSLTHRTVERFNHWVANYGDYGDKNFQNCCTRDDLEVLGLHLYKILFDSEAGVGGISVKQAFDQTYRAFEKQKQTDPALRLRLTLVFHKEAQKLATYPWEFLYMPREPEGFFLSGKQTELILTREIPATGIADKHDPEERPLKILIAFSHPGGLGTVDASEVIAFIKSLNKPGHIDVQYLDNPTYKSLGEALSRQQPHILHFIGHGEERQIALKREAEKMETEEKGYSIEDIRRGKKPSEAEWVPSQSFVELFKKQKPPRLVFLHACKGATSGSLSNFRSTALELVYARIPAVVAMQYEISNNDADIFARMFYQKIDEGKSVDEAVSEGRWLLGTYEPQRAPWNNRGFGTPVLYLQSKGAVIVPRPEPTAQSKQTSAAQAAEGAPVLAKVPCPYPDCTAYVKTTSKICLKCNSSLMLCPNPECRQVMVKTLGTCAECLTRVVPDVIVPKAEELQEAPESPQAPGVLPEQGWGSKAGDLKVSEAPSPALGARNEVQHVNFRQPRR